MRESPASVGRDGGCETLDDTRQTAALWLPSCFAIVDVLSWFRSRSHSIWTLACILTLFWPRVRRGYIIRPYHSPYPPQPDCGAKRETRCVLTWSGGVANLTRTPFWITTRCDFLYSYCAFISSGRKII